MIHDGRNTTGNIYFGSSFDPLLALPQLRIETGKPGSLDELKREGEAIAMTLFHY